MVQNKLPVPRHNEAAQPISESILYCDARDQPATQVEDMYVMTRAVKAKLHAPAWNNHLTVDYCNISFADQVPFHIQ